MRLLLDTHVMLGLVDSDIVELPEQVMQVTRQPATRLFVSVVSVWELAIKHRLGKLPLPCPLAEWPEALAEAAISIIGLDLDPVLLDLDPWPDTRDPFDRLLLAIADCYAMKLLTMDRALITHPLAWRPA